MKAFPQCQFGWHSSNEGFPAIPIRPYCFINFLARHTLFLPEQRLTLIRPCCFIIFFDFDRNADLDGIPPMKASSNAFSDGIPPMKAFPQC
jgi:hypothetical protein